MNHHAPAHTIKAEPTLNLIPRERVTAVAPMLQPMLASVAQRSAGRFTVAGMLNRFMSGDWQLWVIWDGALLACGATFLTTDDDGTEALHIVFWTGENSTEWLHLLDTLQGWAKAQGCTRMRGLMRKGWAKRLPDWKMTHVFLEKDIA